MTQPSGIASNRGTLRYGVASAAANALSYVMSIALARTLHPGDVGVLGALLSLGIIGTIPATAVQLGVSRSASEARADGHRVRRRWTVRVGLSIGAAIFAVVTVLSFPIASYLHLETPTLVLIMGATLVPMLVSSSMMGLLLGTHRLGSLAFVTVATAAARVAAVVLALLVGAGPRGVLLAILIAAIASAFVSWLMVGPAGTTQPPARNVLRVTTRGAFAMTAFFVLSNADVPLARHHLTAADSGVYVILSMFAKICLWGPQFLAVAAYPWMHGRDGRRVTLIAASVTAALGLAAAALIGVLAGPALVVMTGTEQPQWAGYALPFAIMGTGWAVTNTVVLHEIATRTFSSAWWVTLASATTVVAVSLQPVPTSLPAVLRIVLVVSVATAIIGLGRTAVLKGPVSAPNSVRPTAEELLAEHNQQA